MTTPTKPTFAERARSAQLDLAVRVALEADGPEDPADIAAARRVIEVGDGRGLGDVIAGAPSSLLAELRDVFKRHRERTEAAERDERAQHDDITPQ
jgi:hypothetical protein